MIAPKMFSNKKADQIEKRIVGVIGKSNPRGFMADQRTRKPNKMKKIFTWILFFALAFIAIGGLFSFMFLGRHP